MVFRKLRPQEQILKRGQKPIGHILVQRHSAPERAPSDDSGTQDHIVDAGGHHPGHGRDQERRVLVVGVDHHHDVGAGGECLAVTSLLVATITIVAVVHEGRQAQTLRQADRLVGARIIHQYLEVNRFGHVADRLLERLLRIVGGHHYRDSLAVNHGCVLPQPASMRNCS